MGKGNEGAHSSPHSAAIWHLQQRRQYLAVPCAVKPGHACRAMPCNTVGRQARPRLPFLSLPCHALQTSPSHACNAVPLQSTPCLAGPAEPIPAYRAMPASRYQAHRCPPVHATTASRCQALPCLTMPAVPCRSSNAPGLATPCLQYHAEPYRSTPRLPIRSWPIHRCLTCRA